MKHTYLEVTYRRGRPLAAYYYLPRRDADVAVRSEPHPHGLVVDHAEDGRPIGIEITTPAGLVLADLNQLLANVGQPPIDRADLAPSMAA